MAGLLVVGCAGDDGQGDATTLASGTTDVATTDAATEDGGTTEVADSSGDAEGGEAEAENSAGEAPTDSGDDSDDDSGGDSGGSESTGAAPTTGPGVLPGETGLDSFCRRYVECGGTYYQDEQACIDASHDYWGSCATRQAALDAFGGCMSEIECRDWSPDAYNPGSTPCAEQWEDLGNSEPCD